MMVHLNIIQAVQMVLVYILQLDQIEKKYYLLLKVQQDQQDQ